MCLAIPGQVTRWIQRDPPFCEAEVDFSGLIRRCNLSCVPEADVGDYVIVHAGVAISRIDQVAAVQLISELSSAQIADELGTSES